MNFGIFVSDTCEHEIIMEYVNKWILNLWCEDCLRSHEFIMIEHFDTIEEVWNYTKEEE